MWLANLKELKERTRMSTRQIAEKTNLPERTIRRIFTGETEHPYVDTLDLIAKAMGYELGDLFSDTKVVVATDDLVEIKGTVSIVEAQRDLVLAENAILKSENATLTNKIALLEKDIQHKDELLALHNYYTKLMAKE